MNANECRAVYFFLAFFTSPVSNNLFDNSRNQAVINFAFMFSLLPATFILFFPLRHQFSFRSICGNRRKAHIATMLNLHDQML
jgi:hypothetical protein